MKIPPVWVLTLCLPVAVAASPLKKDVNRDGFLDQADVRALARMVAGLDPVDLAFDQDGDNALTLDDVNILLDAVPPTPMTNAPMATPTPRTTPISEQDIGGMVFYAVQRKTTGQCVVVAGDEGLSPGDTVYGAFPTFRQAQYQVVSRCNQGPEAPAARVEVPKAPDPGQSVSPILAIPRYDDDEATRDIFVINLENGRASVIDRVKRTPLEIRSRPFPHNVFNAIGRSTGLPAHNVQVLAGPIRNANGAVHAILLVDTTTGAMAYVTGLGDDPSKARLKRISHFPAQGMADPDGYFAMAMRQDSSGKTVGAYLYHGTTGRCALFKGVGDLRTDITATPITSLPTTGGSVSSMELHGGNEATTHFLLIDNENGMLLLVGGVEQRAAQLTAQTLRYNLVSTFPTDAPVVTPIRFVPVPIATRSGSIDSALVIDVASGAMTVLKDLSKPSKVRLVSVSRSVYGLLPANVGRPRTLTAVPKVSDKGTTRGAWLFDSATDTILFLNGLQDPKNMVVRVVEAGGDG